MIKTSIIVPVYNTAEYLEECFESIFKQTQKEIEVIAINDGSTDDSMMVLQSIRKRHPELTIFSQENQGPGSARNKGIELATGEFIYFMDSDDCLIDIALETCYEYAMTNKLDIVMFDAETFGNIECGKGNYDRRRFIIDQKKILSGEEFIGKYWMTAYYPSICLNYISHSFLKKNELMFLSGVYYEDNEFYCKLIPLAKRVMYIPEVLYKRRYRNGSITMSTFDMRHAKDYLMVMCAIKELEYTFKVKEIVQELLFDFLKSLLKKSIEKNLIHDLEFMKELYDISLDVCGNVIENVTLFRGADLLYEISNVVPENIISGETKKIIFHKKVEILETITSQIPFRMKEKCIGIYGTGKYADFFLDEYQTYIGDISANLIFIESTVKSGEKSYRNSNIFNIDDIGDMPLECIVIASSKYEWEMYRMVKEKYGERFKIVKLRRDLHF